MEIQRLIGRSLRAVVDRSKLGENTIYVDCDVIQADGGTRTASITGAYVAMVCAIKKKMVEGVITDDPLKAMLASVSVGVYKGTPILDLDYAEDSSAETDMNVVMSNEPAFIEVQGTAEGEVFSRKELDSMLDLAESGIQQLFTAQREVLEQI